MIFWCIATAEIYSFPYSVKRFTFLQAVLTTSLPILPPLLYSVPPSSNILIFPHQVKTSDDAQFGEHSWTFRHPDFHADQRDALENIKRKVPAARKSFPSSSNGGHNGDKGASSSSYVPGETSTTELAAVQSYIGVLQNSYQLLFSSHDTLLSSHETLRGQTDSLLASHSSLQAQNDNLFATNGTLRNQVVRAEEQIRVLGRQYGDVLVETVNFQKGWHSKMP
jgi:osomolarity two-component system response regulator SKN7